MRSTAQAGPLDDDGSFLISDAIEKGEIQPYNASDQLCIQESGKGGRRGTLPDPSRQLARALEACDLIKIIVLMQNRKCHEDMEGCAGLLCSPQEGGWAFTNCRATGKQLNLSAQPLHVQGCGILPRSFFFLKVTSFNFKYSSDKRTCSFFLSLLLTLFPRMCY